VYIGRQRIIGISTGRILFFNVEVSIENYQTRDRGFKRFLGYVTLLGIEQIDSPLSEKIQINLPEFALFLMHRAAAISEMIRSM
jgi:hypothetical protein